MNKTPLPFALDSLSSMSIGELRTTWRERLKTPPPPYKSRVLLAHALAYQLQTRLRGGLPAPSRRRLKELATQFATDPRYTPAPPETLQPGTVIIRDWQGRRFGV